MKHILVVDDEPSLREAIVESLAGEADYSILTAEHGVDALKILQEQPIDLMLLDVDMPFLDGVGVVEKMQADPAQYAQPEIIVLTNRADMDTVSQMVKLNTFDYIIKSDHSLEEIITLAKTKLNK